MTSKRGFRSPTFFQPVGNETKLAPKPQLLHRGGRKP
jgi:hypothetical protein